MPSSPVIDKFLDAIETATIPGCDAWDAAATLDATVPNWRLHATGPDAIRAEYARWFADGASVRLGRAVADATALPFRAASSDLAVAAFCLSYLGSITAGCTW